MKNIVYKGLFLFGLLLLLGSCSEELSRQLAPRTMAFGKANQVVVVADLDLWESAVGDTFRYYFASAYPILPQPEPIFDLKHFTPQQLEEDHIRKELRNYVLLADLDQPESMATQLVVKDIGNENAMQAGNKDGRRTRVGRDKWAKGQLLIYLFARGRDELVDNIKSSFPGAAKRIRKADLVQIEATVYQGGENYKLKDEIRQSFGVEIDIPSEYFLAVNDGKVAWLRKETEFLSSNIVIYKLPYTSPEQLSKKGIKRIRDSIGLNYVSSETDNTYMRTNDVDLPMFVQQIELKDYYVLEGRGIWEIVNDYMGGPFVSYLIHKPNSNELVFVDGFVHAPGKRKRQYMQNLELILSSISIP
ncbi:MAG: DUF4837 family protein [Bacteroidota bacterium]